MLISQTLSDGAAANFGISKACTDSALMAWIAKGDNTAMQALFVRYRVQVYRFSLRLTNNRETAEDLTSEAFLEAWRHAGKFEGRSKVSTWLLAIVHHLACSAKRRRSTAELDNSVMETLADCSDNPEVATHKRQQNAILAHCLTKLSPAHREVVDLVYYHEKSIGEVAEIVGCPQSTVKTRMHYARKEIADLLKQFGIDRMRPANHTNHSRDVKMLRRLDCFGEQSDLVH